MVQHIASVVMVQQVLSVIAWVVLLWSLSGVSNLWNGLMEWTDGMEYQLPKIGQTHIMAVAKLKVLSHHCLLLRVDEAMFWQC